MNWVDVLWIVVCVGLVFFQQAGFLCLESGLTRAKNNINVAAKNIVDLALVAFLFWLIGYGLMNGSASHGWFGLVSPFNSQNANPYEKAMFVYATLFCCTAVTIVSGAVAERMKFYEYLVISGFIAALMYPLFAYWVWDDNGWLAAKGFTDFAGATVVHSAGGWTALAAIMVLGARHGRFDQETGEPRSIPASNLPLSTVGALILWIGWLGFNAGSTGVLNELALSALINTFMAGAIGLNAMILLYAFKGQAVNIPRCINGLLAALVAITAVADKATGLECVMVSLSGVLMALTVEYCLLKFKLDDPVGAIPVHLGGGVAGTLSVAFLSGYDAAFSIQLLGVLVAAAWFFIPTCLILFLLKWTVGIRVSEHAEAIGLNYSEHHARSDLVDLLSEIEKQEAEGDLFRRLNEEPFTEVGIIAKRFNRLVKQIKAAHEELDAKAREKTRSLVKARRQLEQSNQLDELTGLFNRDYFFSTLGREWDYSKDNHCSMSLIMIEMKNLKKLRDEFGSALADSCVQNLAEALQEAVVGADDRICVLDSEVLVVVLPHQNEEQASRVLERIKLSVAQAPLAPRSNGERLELWFGLSALCPSPGMRATDLINLARDHMMDRRAG